MFSTRLKGYALPTSTQVCVGVADWQGYLTITYHDSYYQAAASRFPQQVPELTEQQLQAISLFNKIAAR